MPLKGRAITGGAERQQQIDSNASSASCWPSQCSMGMVGNSPANETTTRSWTRPASSPPSAETDEAIAHPNHIQTNRHGVIGEHRLSGRSSSESSGGSNGNNPNSAAGANRRGTSVSQEDASKSLEGTAWQVLQQLDLDSKETPAKDNGATSQIPTNAQGQSQEAMSTPVAPSTELVSQINPLPTPASDGPDPLATLGFMSAERSVVSPQNTQFQLMAGGNRHSRSVTSSTLTPFAGSQPTAESEINRLLNEPILGAGFGGSQVEFAHSHDVFSMASMDNALINQHASGNASQIGNSRNSPNAFAGNGSPFGSGNPQQIFGQVSQSIRAQFQNITTSYQNGKPQQSAAYLAGQQASFSPNPSGGQYFYSANGRQNNGSFSNAGNNGGAGVVVPFNSQNFSMPPPSQHWQRNFNHVTDIQLEKIICDGCNKIFKWPTDLKCLHTYCFPCILKLSNSTKNAVTCPKCNYVTIPDGKGICDLRLDYEKSSYMVKMQYSPFSCTACTREYEAASCCIDCCAYLCLECYERHKIMVQFQGHKLTPITKIGKHRGEYKPMCPNHPAVPEDKYCVTCELMICEECKPDHAHPNMPPGNNYDLREAFSIVAPRLQRWTEDAFIKYSEVKDVVKRFPELLQNTSGKKRNMRRRIEEYNDYLHNVVEQARASAIEKLELAYAQLEVKLQTQMRIYDNLAAGFEGLASFNARTMDCGDNVHFVMKNLPEMEGSYKRLVAIYSEVMHTAEGITVDFTFCPNYPATSDLIFENFHNITYKINDQEYKVVPSNHVPRSDSRKSSFGDYSGNENPDCNYQRWSSATESMNISTWNNTSERDRKSGTFIPNINRCRTRTSYIHVFGEYGRSEYAFTEPSGQAYLKDGSYVICDTNNHRIVYYSANHEYIRSIGQPPNLPPLADDQDHRNSGLRNKGFTRQEGYLYFPNRVAICPITQNIVATERPPSHDIQIFTVNGEFKRCFGGNILQHPRGVTVDEHGTIIVVECKVMKLVMFDQEGTFLVSHSLTKDLEFPNDVAAKGDRIYISDNRGHCVRVFGYDAEFIMKIGFESVTYFPIGVSINYLNQLVVTDNHNTFNITVFDLNGKVLHIFESITKHAQCHNVAVHPSSLELMLTTKDCNVYFFNYDPNAQHPPPTSNVPRSIGHPFNSRRGRGNSNGNGNNSSYYY